MGWCYDGWVWFCVVYLIMLYFEDCGCEVKYGWLKEVWGGWVGVEVKICCGYWYVFCCFIIIKLRICVM